MGEQRHRRRGPDKMVKLITILSAATWFLLILAFIIFSIAKPPEWSLFYMRDRISGQDFLLILSARILTFFNFFISLTGIILNTRRHKRKNDHFHFSLIVSSILSFIFFFILMTLI